MKTTKNYNAVGPVLMAGEITDKLVMAIKKLNKKVEIQDHGSYIRVLVPIQCRLTRQAIQAQTGLSFVLSDDLELIMPSFKGRFMVSKDEALWTFVETQESKQ